MRERNVIASTLILFPNSVISHVCKWWLAYRQINPLFPKVRHWTEIDFIFKATSSETTVISESDFQLIMKWKLFLILLRNFSKYRINCFVVDQLSTFSHARYFHGWRILWLLSWKVLSSVRFELFCHKPYVILLTFSFLRLHSSKSSGSVFIVKKKTDYKLSKDKHFDQYYISIKPLAYFDGCRISAHLV
jgi:hypothetical protein